MAGWVGGLVGWWVGGLVGWWVGGLVGWWVGGLVRAAPASARFLAGDRAGYSRGETSVPAIRGACGRGRPVGRPRRLTAGAASLDSESVAVLIMPCYTARLRYSAKLVVSASLSQF
jgi:hypothetical protein